MEEIIDRLKKENLYLSDRVEILKNMVRSKEDEIYILLDKLEDLYKLVEPLNKILLSYS